MYHIRCDTKIFALRLSRCFPNKNVICALLQMSFSASKQSWCAYFQSGSFSMTESILGYMNISNMNWLLGGVVLSANEALSINLFRELFFI